MCLFHYYSHNETWHSLKDFIPFSLTASSFLGRGRVPNFDHRGLPTASDEDTGLGWVDHVGLDVVSGWGADRTGLVVLAVGDLDLAAPLGNPTDLDQSLVGLAATGSWLGLDHNLDGLAGPDRGMESNFNGSPADMD